MYTIRTLRQYKSSRFHVIASDLNQIKFSKITKSSYNSLIKIFLSWSLQNIDFVLPRQSDLGLQFFKYSIKFMMPSVFYKCHWTPAAK